MPTSLNRRKPDVCRIATVTQVVAGAQATVSRPVARAGTQLATSSRRAASWASDADPAPILVGVDMLVHALTLDIQR
jgi:hypothetical protein